MNLQTIESRLSNIESKLLISTKEVLTLDEVAIYTGLSKSHIYKLCSSNDIPFYKPQGKVNYFNRLEIENWLQQNRVATTQEIEQRAIDRITTKNYKK
jgi:hypothetical protein